MNLTFPITSETIREGIHKTIAEIKEESGWDLARELSAVTIELGDAPEVGSNFGIARAPNKLVFGNWLNEISPNYNKINTCEFLIIRESFAFFISSDILFKLDFELIDYILDLLTCSFLRKKHEKVSFGLKLNVVLYRFIVRPNNIDDKKKNLINKIDALLSNIISQEITYVLILNTFRHYVNELSEHELDADEILGYIYRYIVRSPEEIVAPIYLRDITLQVLQKVVDLGFNATSVLLADNLNIDNTTITRELIKITNRYNAKFRVEKNFYKMGLYYYSIIIRINSEKDEILTQVVDEILKIKYIGEVYDGYNKDYLYVYIITLCPHIVADNLDNKLLKLQNRGLIHSFEVKPLKNRLFLSTLIEEIFTPTLDNYKKLLNNEIPCVKLVTWDNNRFSEDVPYKFTRSEKNLLQFISTYQSHILANPLSYLSFLSQLKEFLVENNIDQNKMDDILGFLNKQRNLLLEHNLIDFRLQLTISNLAINDMLMIKINCDPESIKTKELLDKLAIFSWIAYNIAFESVLIRIQGLNAEHKIVDLITEVITSYGFEYEVFNTKSRVWRYIPFAEVYYFEGNKWAIN
ncbi:MAG: hypothetical protein JXA54_06985 [Candidatus Heimdallarchaeota archaeon]|nr:hypothetical protein [Candidatus Heimdallarchaeota archaeon]